MILGLRKFSPEQFFPSSEDTFIRQTFGVEQSFFHKFCMKSSFWGPKMHFHFYRKFCFINYIVFFHFLPKKIRLFSFKDLHIRLCYKINFSLGNFMQKRKMHFWTPKRLFYTKLMKKTLFYSKSLPYKSTFRI